VLKIYCYHMKKVFVFLFAFLFCVQVISAQWSVGGRIGMNLSKIVDFPIYDSKQKMGWDIAVVGNYAFNDRFEIQGELLYSQRGANGFWYIYSLYDDPVQADINSHYLDIPVLLQFYPFKRTECFNIQVGVQPGVFLDESFDCKRDSPRPAYGKANPIVFGLIFGCSYKFKKGLFLDGRYVLGLTDHYKDYNGMMKGRSIQLSIGYLFQLK